MPQSLDNLSTTWTGTTVYTGIKFSALDSGSGASLMMDLRAGAAGTTSVFSVAKSGNITLGSGTGAGNVNIGSATTLNLLNLGVSNSGVGILGVSEGNNRTSLYGNIAVNGQTYLRSNVLLSWSSSSTSAWDTVDLTLGRDAANTLAQRNGTNPQAFRVYNTFTSDTNFERGFMRWNANVLEIGTEKGSLGGSTRGVKLIGGEAAQWLTLSSNQGALNGGFGTETAPRGSLVLNNAHGVMLVSNSASNNRVLFGNGTSLDQFTTLNSSAAVDFGPVAASNTQFTHTLRPTAKDLLGGYTGAGHHLAISAGAGAAGNNDGGNLYLRPGAATGTGTRGYVVMDQLPTSAAGLPTGALWNNSGVLSIA